MNAKEGLRFVSGSIIVYVVMAACASGAGNPGLVYNGGEGSDSSAVGSSAGGPGATGAGSGSGGNDSGGMSGIVDALTDPVPVAQADPTQSGSRLKAQYYVGSDGSKQFAGWHDSTLNVACSFQPASDGTTRCLPAFGTTDGTAEVLGFFSDSGCTQPLANVSKGCAPAYAWQSGTASTCPINFIRIFQVGAAYSGVVYVGSPASCTATTAGGVASSSYYSVGPEVAPSQFVAATLQTDP